MDQQLTQIPVGSKTIVMEKIVMFENLGTDENPVVGIQFVGSVRQPFDVLLDANESIEFLDYMKRGNQYAAPDRNSKTHG